MIEKNKKISTDYLLFFVLFAFLLLVLININSSVVSVKNALKLWCESVLPTLFPFMFITALLSSINDSKIIKLFSSFSNKIFNAPKVSGYIFFMSALCGYPIGAKLCGEYYNKKLLSQTNCNKILTFSALTGPVFCIGTIGLMFFDDTELGINIFVVQLLSAILCGIILRQNFIEKNDCELSFIGGENILYTAMASSVTNILIVGGYIVIFSIITDLLLKSSAVNFSLNKLANFLNIDCNFLTSLVIGSVEMTRGIKDISLMNINKKTAFVAISFLLSFGGLSVFLQSFAFLGKGIDKSKFFLTKLLQSIISVILSLVFILLQSI